MKQRRYSDKYRAGVLAKIKAGTPVADLATRRGIHPSVIYGWLRAAKGLPTRKDRKPPSRTDDAITYLQNAALWIHQAIAARKLTRLDRAHTLALLALSELVEHTQT